MAVPKVAEIHYRKEPHRDEYGCELNKAISLYEEPTRYPVDQLIRLVNAQMAMMKEADDGKRAELHDAFMSLLNSIEVLPEAREKVRLWPEDKVPTQTDYTENPGYIFDHDPGYIPFYLEMLIEDERETIGSVILIAGGSHGIGTISECYQIGREFNELGYQAFILQCRPNNCPWNEYEVGADVARAIRIIRSRAEEYRIDPDRIAIAGFSNGGLTCDFAIEHYSGNQKVKTYFPDYEEDALDEISATPDAFICVYGTRYHGTPYDYTDVVYPPTFIAVGREDTGAMKNMDYMTASLKEQGIPFEVHTFAGHPHGFAGHKIFDGKGDPNFDLWLTHAHYFLQDIYRKRGK